LQQPVSEIQDGELEEDVEVDVKIKRHRGPGRGFSRSEDDHKDNDDDDEDEGHRTLRIKFPPLFTRIWKATQSLRTYVLLPLLQGAMLGLGQHGTRYLLSGWLTRRAVTSR